MKKTNSNIAFVYHYWNINNLMSYYGYKEDWNQKKYSTFDIFVEHPLGENSTNTHYCSSCKQKEWKEACKRGEIYGEIIAIFIGENAGNLAHEYEHQMIITHKALYGQESLYNRNDGYAKFSTSGIAVRGFLGKHHSEETRKKQSVSAIGKHSHSEETRKKLSKAAKERQSNPEVRKKQSERMKGENHPFYGTHRSEETKKKIGDGNRGKKLSEETKKKISEKIKGRKYHIKNIDMEEVKRLSLEEHLSLDEISKIIGVNPQTIKSRCLEIGFDYYRKTSKKENNGRYIDIDIDKVLELYKNGLTSKQIGQILGVSDGIINKRLKWNGLTGNKRNNSGENNSAYGRKWITNGVEHKYLKANDVENFLKENTDWRLGQSDIHKRKNGEGQKRRKKLTNH